MDDWQLVGPVVRLQVQTAQIVYGGEYHIDHLARAESLWITTSGVVGVTEGKAILDCHHRDHPGKSVFNPQRRLSIGFTGHYGVMSSHFGKVAVGLAAENIIVEYAGQLSETDVSGGLRVETATGLIELTGAAVAKPCVPFTRFLLGAPAPSAASLAEHRSLLDDGVRGFVMSTTGSGTNGTMIHEGDQVYRRVHSSR